MKSPSSTDVAGVLSEFDVDPDSGLSSREAERRLDEHGPNVIQQRERTGLLQIAIDQFESVIMALLAVAGILAALIGSYLEAVAIAAAVIVNGVIGFVTELRARKSIEALQRLDETTATVRRDDSETTIAARDLVPGDVVSIGEGDLVAADLRIVESTSLRIDESPLTGESVPVDKAPDALDVDDAPLAERSSMAFKGTAVTSGSGLGIVVSTGRETEIGRIAEMAEEAEGRATPLERRLDALGTRLIWVTAVAAVSIAAVGLVVGRETQTIVETSIALGLAAVPEGLPVVASLALARGAYRLARDNAIVKRLSAVETLGSAGVILTDKTGTLTEGTMALHTVAVGLDRVDRDDVPDDDAATRLIRLTALCTDVEVDGDGNRSGNPMEVALLEAIDQLDVGDEFEHCERTSIEPFDPDRKMMATTHRCGDEELLVVKGAPEAVLNRCGGLDDVDAWRSLNLELASDGLRVIAVATKRDDLDHRFRDLELEGLVGFVDPVRDGVRESVETCRRAGIRVVMVTGDQAETALAIAEEVGLATGDRDPAMGSDLHDLSEADEETSAQWRSVSVFARVAPEHKLDLIALHQGAGAVVAMTGDGVNDAPALEQADIGIAMGERGTDVASDAADIVLLDDAFGTIVTAIESGRAIFRNIRSFVVYLLSGNLAEVLAVAIATLAGLPLPLLPLQILYINFVADVFPALALGVSEASEDVMDEDPRDPSESILTRRHWAETIGWGVLIAAILLTLELVALEVFGLGTTEAVTITFLGFGFVRIVHTFNMRRSTSRLFVNEVTTNRWVWAAVAVGVGLMAIAIWVPPLADALSVVEPDATGWWLIAGGSAAALVLGQAYRTVE